MIVNCINLKKYSHLLYNWHLACTFSCWLTLHISRWRHYYVAKVTVPLAQQSSFSWSPLCCCSLHYCFVWVSRTSLATSYPRSPSWISSPAEDDTAHDGLSSLRVCLFENTFHHNWHRLVCSFCLGKVHPPETPGWRTDWVSPSSPDTRHLAKASSSPRQECHFCPRVLGDDQLTSWSCWTLCRSEHTWRAWVCVCGRPLHSLTSGTYNGHICYSYLVPILLFWTTCIVGIGGTMKSLFIFWIFVLTSRYQIEHGKWHT